MLVAVLVVSGGLAAAIGGVAAADSGKPAPVIAPVAAASAPAGYQVRVTRPIVAPVGALTFGVAKCKGASEFPIGGGALVDSQSTQVSLGSDSPQVVGPPDRDVWAASVFNRSAAATSFRVYVVCIDVSHVSSAFTERGPFIAFGHSQTAVSLGGACPQPGEPYSIGSWGPYSGTLPDGVVVHGTHPTLSGGWEASVDNLGGATEGWATPGVCSQVYGVHTIVGPPVPNPPGTQTLATAMCDTGVPVSGGIGSSSTSFQMSVNSSSPIPGGWSGYENNDSRTHQDTIRAYVMCGAAWPPG
jgi:hypothetical protein